MEYVKITDVTPRDGLQDASGYVPLENKLALVKGLYGAGIRSIEATAFVRSQRIPFLPDGDQLLGLVQDLDAEWVALVPNPKGVGRAIRAGADTVTIVVSASESHNRANLNRSQSETLDLLRESTLMAHEAGLHVRGAVSTAFACPFEGNIPWRQVEKVMEAYLQMGVDELSIADTIGTATPLEVKDRVSKIRALATKLPPGIHLHARFGWALANVAMAYEYGVRRFESALAGLGGCPYAPGAAGNLDTEHLVMFFHAQGIETGINDSLLKTVKNDLIEVLNKHLPPPNFSDPG